MLKLSKLQMAAIIAAAPRGLTRSRAGWIRADQVDRLHHHSFMTIHSLLERGYLRQGQRSPIENKRDVYLTDYARDVLPQITAKAARAA